MNKYEKIARLELLFKEYIKILKENNGWEHVNFIKGLLIIINDYDCCVEERLKDARDYYISMRHIPQNTISISNEDSKKLEDANGKLSKVKREIYFLLDCDGPHQPVE